MNINIGKGLEFENQILSISNVFIILCAYSYLNYEDELLDKEEGFFINEEKVQQRVNELNYKEREQLGVPIPFKTYRYIELSLSKNE